MNYIKTIWLDYPNLTTPVTAARLNNLENGVEYAVEQVEGKADVNKSNVEAALEYKIRFYNDGDTIPTLPADTIAIIREV